MTAFSLTHKLRAAFICVFLFAASSLYAAPQLAPETERFVTFKTDLGTIVLELYPKEAPITVANFLAYVDSGFFDGTIFHRVLPNFVVQGGGYTINFVQKETLDPIKNESDNGLKNGYLTLSMARTNSLNSATSQFFINLKPNTNLDPKEGTNSGYAVFAKVISGSDVVHAIEAEPQGIFKSRGYPNAPNAAVRILKASRGSTMTRDAAKRVSKFKGMLAQ